MVTQCCSLLQLVGVAAVVLVTMFVVTTAQLGTDPSADPNQASKKCVSICHSIKVGCVEKICTPKLLERDSRWWCVGGCLAKEDDCFKFCMRASELKKE